MTEKRKELVKRLIVRYIRDNKLPQGSKLPGALALRALFDCGGRTLFSAIMELKELGVVSVQDKVGVYVNSPDACSLKGRRIGLVATGFWENRCTLSIMMFFLMRELNRNDCQILLFQKKVVNDDVVFNSLSNLPELLAAVKAREVDAVLSVILLDRESEEFIRRQGIPLVYTGFIYTTSCRNIITVDYDHMISESVRLLSEARCSRVEYVQLSTVAGMSDCFEKAARSHLRRKIPANWIHLFSSDHVDFVQELETLVDSWLARPVSERPEGVVVLDDFATNCLVHQLLSKTTWRPKLISVHNEDIPLPMDYCVLGFWSLAIWQFVSDAVEHFLGMLRMGESTLPSIILKPPYSQNPAFCLTSPPRVP